MENRKIKILHASDFHIGLSSWDKIDSQSGLSARYLECARTLGRIREIADEENCQLVLITGDIFHRRNPQPHENNLLAKFLIELTSTGKAVAIIRGNHEMPKISGGEHAIGIYRTLEIPGVYIIDKDKPQIINTKSGEIQIAGIPYPTKKDAIEILGEDFKPNAENWNKYFEKTIENLSKKLRPDIPAVLALHVYISGAKISSNYLPHSKGEPIAMISALARPEFSYIAAGHIHRYQEIPTGNGANIVYAGSTIKASFAEQDQKKGIIIAEIDKKAEYRFIPIETVRQMLTIEIDLTGESDIEGQIRKATMGKKLNDAIIRIFYKIENDKPPIKRSFFNEIIPEAFKLIPMRQTAESQKQTFTKLSAAEPIAELAAYIDSKGKYENRKKELLELANEIIQTINNDTT